MVENKLIKQKHGQKLHTCKHACIHIKFTKSALCRHDDGLEVDDIQRTIPTQYLQDLALAFYKANVSISTTRMKEIELLTSKHSDYDYASVIWKSERRLQIISTNVKAICQR